ncbi:MAG: hypothetical protein IJX13_03270, partial [Clostridia bacterium]|nr:hypothetical protein [Clostridia bacterium]
MRGTDMSEKLSTQPYKGTRDFYPQEMKLRNWFFGVIRKELENAAFEEYNGPMLESLEIYAAKSGEETRQVNLLALCRAIGVEHVVVADPFDLKNFEKVVKEETEREEPSVIIAQRPCALLKR